MTFSRSIEDYIKAIYELRGTDERVSSTALAGKLGVTPASVTGMIKRIAAERPDVVDYAPHHGVLLTAAGEAIALHIVRRHRLVELFLTTVLGYSWDEVHEEAERLEHVISDRMEERMARYLGHPAVDPHGDPIPTSEGTVAKPGHRALSTVGPGEPGVIRRVASSDDKLLLYLGDLGLVLGARVTVVEKAPFAGPVHLELDTPHGAVARVIGSGVAERIFVDAP
jgi:DtxR family transcriptional regulator, Mn-dependent transcriptional regulator